MFRTFMQPQHTCAVHACAAAAEALAQPAAEGLHVGCWPVPACGCGHEAAAPGCCTACLDEAGATAGGQDAGFDSSSVSCGAGGRLAGIGAPQRWAHGAAGKHDLQQRKEEGSLMKERKGKERKGRDKKGKEKMPGPWFSRGARFTTIKRKGKK
eukprot:1151951-Pelagomonas_calceolata.AAC.1